MRTAFILLVLASISSVTIAQTSQRKAGDHVVCYYTEWSSGRKEPYDFQPHDVDPFLCTHIIYAFAVFGKNYDFDTTQGFFMKLQPKVIDLKTRNPQLKVMFAAGGWKEGSTGFAEITKNEESINKFSNNVVTFLRDNKFDGIDLNWQHPTYREGGKPEDRQNYVILAQTLRTKFEEDAMKTGRPRLLLAISITQLQKALPGYDIQSFNNYMDFISVLCYDYVFSHTTTAKHHAPLFAVPDSRDYEEDKTLNIDYTINYFLEYADADKLVLGIPTYGRSFRLLDPNDTELGAEADGAGDKGPYTDNTGYLAYFEICSKINNEKWTVAQTKPYGTVGPHAFKGNQWVGYDDVEMVRTKAKYAKQRGLAGVVFWNLDFDDFQGNCGGRRFPLINAAKEVLRNSSESEMIFPTEPVRPTVQPMRPAVQPMRPAVRPMRPTVQPMRPRPRPLLTQEPVRPLPTNTPMFVDRPRQRPTVEMTPPPSLEDIYATPPQIGMKDMYSEDNDLQNDLVGELIQLIERAGGMKGFCRILKEAKRSFRKPGGFMRRNDDVILDVPYLEPFRLLISNSSVTIQELNVYGAK